MITTTCLILWIPWGSALACEEPAETSIPPNTETTTTTTAPARHDGARRTNTRSSLMVASIPAAYEEPMRTVSEVVTVAPPTSIRRSTRHIAVVCEMDRLSD